MPTHYSTATKKHSAAKLLPGRSQSMTDGDAFAVLCQHAISHLPDSIAGRQALLAALILQGPRNSPLLQHVRELQWHLQAHLGLCKMAPADAAQPAPTPDPSE
jgi:hypothetical protein